MAKATGGVREQSRGRRPPGRSQDAFTAANWGGEPRSVDWAWEQNDRKTIRNLFGRQLSNRELLQLTGAPTGSGLTVYAQGDDELWIEVSHPWLWSQRKVSKSRFGGLVIDNIDLRLHGDAPKGMGIGTRTFASQVRKAAELGIPKIRTTAGRTSELNGYYTWARTGYNGPLSAQKRFLLESDTGIKARDVRTMMSTKAGRDWWRSQGEEWDGTFDTSPGSQSRRDLDAYLEEIGAQV